MMSRDRELARKEERVRQFLAREKLDGLVLSKNANFSWITCGGSNHVAVNTDVGVAHALITHAGKWIICDNIEARRIMEEEVAGLGFQNESFYWYENKLSEAITHLAAGAHLGSDSGRAGTDNVEPLLSSLRASLLPGEVERYHALGRITAQAMTEACRCVEPGMTEHQAAGILAGELLSRGAFPVVLLVAADVRAFTYRHPIPTDKPIEKHVMLVVCGRRSGLICSMTRLVHFGPVPADLRRKHDAVMRVDAAFITNSMPGSRVGDAFAAGIEAYAATGFPEEWRLHHQGGPTGYVGREYRATSSSDQVIVPNQAFAWNPSIAGTKSEDTIVALADGPEVICATPELPSIEVEVRGKTMQRADILVR
jgi:Xaa-Pro aminopeptidase